MALCNLHYATYIDSTPPVSVCTTFPFLFLSFFFTLNFDSGHTWVIFLSVAFSPSMRRPASAAYISHYHYHYDLYLVV